MALSVNIRKLRTKDLIAYSICFIIILIAGLTITYLQNRATYPPFEQKAVNELSALFSQKYIQSVKLLNLPNRKEIYQDVTKEITLNKKKVSVSKELKNVNNEAKGELKVIADGEIIQRIYLSPGRDYEEIIFVKGDKKIARLKSVNGNIVESSGQVPDGLIPFVDDFRKTYGEIRYMGGTKHGKSKTYYQEGTLKNESLYGSGILLEEKEYYSDGALRLEGSYRNAKKIPGEKEVGLGKIYYRNGKVRYEWKFLASQQFGVKKSYAQDGTLKETFKVDSSGNRIDD